MTDLSPNRAIEFWNAIDVEKIVFWLCGDGEIYYCF